MKLGFSFLVGVILAGAQTVGITAQRLSKEPILSPRPGWMSAGVFNPAAVTIGGKTVLLFRAQDAAHTSRIGYAESKDGLHFSVRAQPVLAPETDYETGGGVEDPRLVSIDGTFYLTYTGYNLRDAQLCLATSKDLVHWERKGVIIAAGKSGWHDQWTKSGAILPAKVGGKWWMYYLGSRQDTDGERRDYMGVAKSDDLLHWEDATSEPVLSRRPGMFDSRVMEPGPAPLLTPAGILLLYNGADDHLVYGPGWVMFDKQHPERVLARAEMPFLLPQEPWEKVGNVPNVIFLEGVVGSGFHLTGYYGAADKQIGVMQISIRFPR